MKVVALVSGGKDSCYTAMKCEAYGHDVVALANIKPMEGIDDADSYMYQTVGHEGIDAYSECFGLPLFRQETSARSIETNLAYGETNGDEVEDLVALLQQVKSQLPDVQAVCSGAVLSNYQRLRVENAAARVGLTSLAFLWQRDQKELLHEMIDAGVEAILVKVATIGLDPRRHLGKTLKEIEPHMLSLDAKYGVSVCGEGGEYETFVTDCPLFKKRVVIDKSTVVVVHEDRFAPVGYLKIEELHVEEKDTQLAESLRKCVPVCTPPKRRSEQADYRLGDAEKEEMEEKQRVKVHREAYAVDLRSSSAFSAHYGNVYVETRFSGAKGVQLAMEKAEEMLRAENFSWTDVYFVHLFIADMSDFGAANAVYCSFLPSREPAARACVGCGHGTRVDVLVTRRQRKTLHVQSISEWAPPCIGPYAQSNTVEDLVYLADVVSEEVRRTWPSQAIVCIVPVAELPRAAKVELCAIATSNASENEPKHTSASLLAHGCSVQWYRVESNAWSIVQVEVSGEGDAAQAGADVLQAECRSELLNVRFFSGESCAPFRAAITKRSSASVTTVPTVGAPGTSVSNSPTVPADRVRYIAQGFGHWNAPSASL